MKELPQQYYLETKRVLPTLEDADTNGKVLAFNGVAWLYIAFDCVNATYYTHWMQMPKAPRDSDRHAFLDDAA